MPLMPTTAKGLNIFHASQVIPNGGPGDSLDDDESGGANVEEEREDDVDHVDDADRVDEEREEHADRVDENRLPAPEIEAGEERIPWSPSPPPQIRTPHPSAINHKRRHSAISSSTTSTTGSLPKRTRRDVGSAGALQGLTAELNTFGDTFLEGIALAAPAPSALAPSPVRKTRAITRAQELEVDLDDGKLAALIRIFQSDVNAADAYMVIKRAGLHKAWIEDTLPVI
jgi:hypothetical protein